MPIKVKKSTAFEKMFVAYRNKFSLSEGDVRFVVDGARVKPFHTPEFVSAASYVLYPLKSLQTLLSVTA